ncbi:MAG: DUF420 domain-containing protein [Halobacteriota archaeon]
MDTPVLEGPIRDRPGMITALLSIVGYAAVVGVFLVPQVQALFPRLTLAQVDFLADAIAIVNSVAVLVLALGWYWIRAGEVRKHARAMVVGFGLILLFLAMYLPKVAGGGTKEFVLDSAYAWVPLFEWVYPAYLAMLAIHILLSILAVPLVLYAIVLGVSHTPEELRTQTPHATVGRLAAGTWILSLALGVVTYLMLNHLYAWEFVAA